MHFVNSESIFIFRNKTDKFSKDQTNIKHDEFGNKKVEINIESNDSISNFYYNNSKTNQFVVKGAIFENLKMVSYIYEDEGAQNISWILKDSTKNISGYECQRATCEFRGRTYEAWFTTKIPLSYGPWKLCGLPGLIIEVYDQNKEVYFIAEEIKIPFEGANDILEIPFIGKKIDQKEFVEKNNTIIESVTKAYLSRLPKGVILQKSETKSNLLELEYDWEKN